MPQLHKHLNVGGNTQTLFMVRLNLVLMFLLFFGQNLLSQNNPTVTFKLLRLKDNSKMTPNQRLKLFYLALASQDSLTRASEQTKYGGAGYYGIEGWTHYDSTTKKLSLWKSHKQLEVMVSYASFLDLNNDNKLDIVFSNIYDQFFKTNRNWTDIYFNIGKTYKAVSLSGYLLRLTKESASLIKIVTVEQPVEAKGGNFLVHTFTLNIKTMTIEVEDIDTINQAYVVQRE